MRYAKIGLLALVLAGVAGVGAARGAAKGETPPDFTGTTLDGRKITLSEFRGKNPVVLNFYADFCAPCKKEFPHLRALDEKLGPKGLRIISVSLDEDRATAANMPNESRVKFPVIFDPRGGIAGKYNVQALPHTVVMERNGKISTVLIGYNPTALDRAVEQVMR